MSGRSDAGENGRASGETAARLLGGDRMAIDFHQSWMNDELEMVPDTATRFIYSEMMPHNEQARKQGHVGHAIWRKAGEVGLLCGDIPE